MACVCVCVCGRCHAVSDGEAAALEESRRRYLKASHKRLLLANQTLTLAHQRCVCASKEVTVFASVEHIPWR